MERSTRVALTGTPGTGKSAVAARLQARWRTEEVADLALRLGAGRRIRGGVEVDLRALARQMQRSSPRGLPVVVVGHLAHLLPVRDAIVLRCHPVELADRLRSAHRGSEPDRRANVEAEATDVVLIEALRHRRRIWEVDTTGRSIGAVAREVASIVRRRVKPRRAPVDWLADPRVTDFLLRRAP